MASQDACRNAARFGLGVAVVLAAVLAVAAPAVLSAAEPGAGAYAKAIAAESDLVTHWPLNGDLKAAPGKADAEPKGGPAEFVPGPGGAKAMLLDKGRYVTLGSTPELDLPETTVELWFRLDFRPNPGYNPCILAKRADGEHTQTRFSIHAAGDYSAIDVWNGRAVMQYRAGDGPLEGGRWYHLALSCTAKEMRMFLDGVPCELDGPAQVFQFERKNLPFSVGSSQPKGAELLQGAVAEVAVYRRALDEAQVAAHVDAMGFQKDRLALLQAREARIEREARLRVEQDARREARRKAILAEARLPGRGTTYYAGKHLDAIRFPVGGIGSGSIQLNGRAERRAPLADGDELSVGRARLRFRAFRS